MKYFFQPWLMISFLTAMGCTTDHLAQGIYEGSQNRSQSLKTPQERAIEPPPQSYRDYDKERERLRKRPATE